jgi:hypothetical protein
MEVFHVFHISILVSYLVKFGFWVVRLDFTLMPSILPKVLSDDGPWLIDLFRDGFGTGSGSAITL